jgi:hypothetical protein
MKRIKLLSITTVCLLFTIVAKCDELTLKEIVKNAKVLSEKYRKEYMKAEKVGKEYDVSDKYKPKFIALDSLITQKVFKLLSTPSSIENAKQKTKNLVKWREYPKNPTDVDVYRFISFDDKNTLYVNYRFFKINDDLSFFVCENSIHCPREYCFRVTPRKYIILFENGKRSLHFIGKPFSLHDMGVLDRQLGVLGVIVLKKTVYLILVTGLDGRVCSCGKAAFNINEKREVFRTIWFSHANGGYRYNEKTFNLKSGDTVYNLKKELKEHLETSPNIYWPL